MDKLQRYLRAAAKHTFNEHKQCPVSALHSDLAILPDTIQQRLTQLMHIEHQWVSAVFYAALQNGELVSHTPAPDDADQNRQDQADDMARLFIFTCKGALFYARLQGPEFFNQSMALLLQQWLPLSDNDHS